MENFTDSELITLLAILGEQTNNTVNKYIEILDNDRGENYEFGENYVKPHDYGFSANSDKSYTKIVNELNKRKVLKEIYDPWLKGGN